LVVLLLASFQHGFDVEREKHLNFLASVNNSSTFSYFTVVTVKNLNTGVVKEICTDGAFVAGALHMEYDSNYTGGADKRIEALLHNNQRRYFEFQSLKALYNVSFDTYNPTLAQKIDKRIIDAIVEKINRTKTYSIRLPDDEMKALAHALFNRGYMTGESNCFGGELFYVDRNELNRK